MNEVLSIHSIEDGLSRALQQFISLPGIGEQNISDSLSSLYLKKAVNILLEEKHTWLTAVPAFHDLQKWVEVYWNAERQTHPPAGTISTGDKQGNQGEVQLDALSATCKLLLAAVVHGTETVTKHALEFAEHGMIEVRSIYLLNGLSISNKKPLDDYCALVLYEEAMRKVSDYPWPPRSNEDLQWPPGVADCMCALEVTSFERRGVESSEFERYVSPLLRCGFETLELILGLVWGTGFRMFRSWNGIPESVAATLPFFHTTLSGGGVSQQTLLAMPGFTRPASNRPLNDAELVELTGKYATLPKQTQRVLNLALRRLRDSTERIGVEDKVIDLCIALEDLFMESGEFRDQRKIIAGRGSWHFADSLLERDQTRKDLKAFYQHRSDIVHGVTTRNLAPSVEDQRRDLLAKVDDVVRASLKTMIAQGRPSDWEKSKDFKAIRHSPPRAKTKIPSVKSDSLSWSVQEQEEIDQALEAVWKPTVDNAPTPLLGAGITYHQGVNREQIEQYRQQGIAYIIRIPAILYMAHPKWTERADDPLDDHTRYYCERDVKRHMQRWQKAADEKRLHQFELPLEDATMYLPINFGAWRVILAEEP